MGFSPLAAQLDKEGKVNYGVAQMPTNAGTPVTLGVEDYLMAFKKKDNQDAVKKFLDLYYQPENITRWITAEGFLPVTKSGDRWTIDRAENVAALNFLADLANGRRLTQVNPGKTNRTDGAFQLFKDGKVGMVMGFSPLATQLDAEKKVSYGVVEMPTAVGQPVTLGVEDYLMAFKKKGNQEAVRQFLDLYYQPDQITRWITAEGFLPVTKSGLEKMGGNEKLKPYLAALPSARLAPTTDPVWDKVKLDVQQNIGAAVQPGGDPKQVLDRIQKNAAESAR